jgi:hypothetical protein
MNIPGFTADASLHRSATSYAGDYYHRQSANSHTSAVVPAIPACKNCDFILENCEQNGWHPRAVCNACMISYCYNEPPLPNPFPDPFSPLPRF